MAPDTEKRKPLAAEHLAALDGLERGLAFNTTHTVARELTLMGYASTDWGRLCITEAGRIALRHAGRSFTVIDDNISNMSAARLSNDPMSAPQLSKMERTAIILIEEEDEPRRPLPAPTTEKQKALRAAGVASGVTGVWVDDAWVHAFIDAFVADEDTTE